MRSVSVFFSLCLFLLVAAPLLPASSGPAEAAPRHGGMVYFQRPPSFSGRFTRPWVEINGEKIGTIGAGECHRAWLPAGRHRVIVRDQRGLLSYFRLNFTSIDVWNGAQLFVQVTPTQEQADFNQASTAYHLTVSTKGRPCS